MYIEIHGEELLNPDKRTDKLCDMVDKAIKQEIQNDIDWLVQQGKIIVKNIDGEDWLFTPEKDIEE